MLRQQCKGWLNLVAFASMLTACAATTYAQEGSDSLNDYVAFASARNDTQPRNGRERIEMTFQAAEEDILTLRAMEKLEVPIESLEFVNAELPNVIRIIGQRIGINFIFDSADIQGRITLHLQEVRLRDALDSILATRNLALVPDRSGIFRIVPRSRVGGNEIETRTEVIQLNWISAVDVKSSLEAFLTKGVGKMEANEESNSLILTDVPPQIATIRELIDQIDVPERQVLLEARLADIGISALRNLGTNWAFSKPVPGRDGLLGDDPPLVQTLLDSLGVTGGVGGTLGLGDTVTIFGDDYDVSAIFQALEQRNVVEILANPRVTTLNNVPASIEIVERIPYRKPGETQGGGLLEEIEFVDSGVKIQVKPIITPNGFVRMQINLIQSIFRQRVGDDPLDPPQIDERIADTNVIVPTGNTVVLGGLRQQRRVNGIDGVPWFHRIPVLGWLFKTKNYDDSKTELVLMMTPSIIEEEIMLTDREMYWYDKIDTQWHLPDYFWDDTADLTDIE